MAEQPELDLPLPPPSGRSPKPKRTAFAGLTRLQWVTGLLVLAALAWGMWVTKRVIAPRRDQIVVARLSGIVGDYVQAQARSASPPEQIEAEMRRFMASLDHELQRRSAKGQIVLVGEAVLTKNVPDITESLKKAVYSTGLARPLQVGSQEMPQLDHRTRTAGPEPRQQQFQGPAMPVDPLEPQGQPIAPARNGRMPQPAHEAREAAVSTFGGGDVPSGD